MFSFFKKNKVKEKHPSTQQGNVMEAISRETLQHAVTAFGQKDTDLQSELDRIAGGSQVTAQQLYWFIPTAMFHIFFPEVETIDGSYTVIYPDQSKKMFLFSQDSVYNAIYEYLKSVRTDLDKDTVHRILGYSSELDAVNQALKARDEANLEPNLKDLLLTGPVYIMNE